MIQIMQAYESGEQIQVKNTINDTKWKEIEFPGWNWIYYDYRVKPKSKYVPFETAEEFLAAQRAHGEVIVDKTSGEKHPADVTKDYLLEYEDGSYIVAMWDSSMWMSKDLHPLKDPKKWMYIP